MTKQELAEKTVEKLVRDGEFSRWLGVRVKDVDPGSVTLQMKVRPEMQNGIGVVHGGIAYSLADTALGFAANSHGKVCTAIEHNISYLEKIGNEDLLTATATELSAGKKIGVYRVIVTRNDGETVAISRGTVQRTDQNHF